MSGPNTPATYYIDSQSAKAKCVEERKAIDKHCKPEAPRSDEDEKKNRPRKRKGGLAGKLGDVADGLDGLGKKSAGYKRDKRSRTATDGNAWMEDNCSGLWVTPITTADPAFEKMMTEMFDKMKSDRFSLMKSAFDELKGIAIEKAGQAAIDKAFWFGVRAVAKGVVGAVGVETVAVPIAMGAWTAADLVSTAVDLAKLAGTQGQAALDAIMDIKNVGEKADKILDDYKKNPHKAQSDAMSLMAQLDPCTRARKCMLVPYKNTEGTPKAVAQANHGQGCCPGQTGHHVLPDSMVAGAGCAGYDKGDAPTICLEGTKNGFKHGSHGLAHQNLSDSMKEYRKNNNGTDTISYDEAKKQGIDAVRNAGALQCDPKCLEAQLDAHYKGCAGKNLKAVAGTGGGTGSTDGGNNGG